MAKVSTLDQEQTIKPILTLRIKNNPKHMPERQTVTEAIKLLNNMRNWRVFLLISRDLTNDDLRYHALAQDGEARDPFIADLESMADFLLAEVWELISAIPDFKRYAPMKDDYDLIDLVAESTDVIHFLVGFVLLISIYNGHTDLSQMLADAIKGHRVEDDEQVDCLAIAYNEARREFAANRPDVRLPLPYGKPFIRHELDDYHRHQLSTDAEDMRHIVEGLRSVQSARYRDNRLTYISEAARKMQRAAEDLSRMAEFNCEKLLNWDADVRSSVRTVLISVCQIMQISGLTLPLAQYAFDLRWSANIERATKQTNVSNTEKAA